MAVQSPPLAPGYSKKKLQILEVIVLFSLFGLWLLQNTRHALEMFSLLESLLFIPRCFSASFLWLKSECRMYLAMLSSLLLQNLDLSKPAMKTPCFGDSLLFKNTICSIHGCAISVSSLRIYSKRTLSLKWCSVFLSLWTLAQNSSSRNAMFFSSFFCRISRT